MVLDKGMERASKRNAIKQTELRYYEETNTNSHRNYCNKNKKLRASEQDCKCECKAKKENNEMRLRRGLAAFYIQIANLNKSFSFNIIIKKL